MNTLISYKSLCDLRKALIAEKEFLTYDDLAMIHGVNKYYLWHIIQDENYRPKDHILHKLNIVEPVQVNVWVLVVLLRYYKPAKPRAYKHWRDMPQWAVRWMLDNREPLA